MNIKSYFKENKPFLKPFPQILSSRQTFYAYSPFLAGQNAHGSPARLSRGQAMACPYGMISRGRILSKNNAL
ncbi:MAG: hypothetical protein LBK12_06740 [Odoribacteraceae bacterium]|jgi:hypothetical protein|nr:hypothetical protein [Odoribacteraceae bacterium]